MYTQEDIPHTEHTISQKSDSTTVLRNIKDWALPQQQYTDLASG